jgi:hypothetical protein
VVIVDEPGRSLRCSDVPHSLGVPVTARVPIDASISRAVDAGMLASRVPRVLSRALRPLLASAALVAA